MSPRSYHVRPDSDGYRKGFCLLMEDGYQLVEVPEASTILFRTEDEALAFAEAIEHPPGEDPDQYVMGLEDDRDALASAGFVEED